VGFINELSMPNYCHNFFTVKDITLNQWCELAETFVDSEGYVGQDFLDFPQSNYSSIPVDEETRRDWSFDHWGNASDIYDCSTDIEKELPSDKLSAEFITSWDPPSEEFLAMTSVNFPGSILINYYKSWDEDICGVTVAKDGVAKDINETMSDYLEPFVRHRFPDIESRLGKEVLDFDLDLDLCVYVRNNSESSEFTDFVFSALESFAEETIHQIEEELKKSTADIIDLPAVASPQP
jgi:hypothetical protein